MRVKTMFWIQIKHGRNKRWYWALRCYNGHIMADCAQGNGYSSKTNATKAARNTIRAFRQMPLPIRG